MTDGANVLPIVPLPRAVRRGAGVLTLRGLVEVDVDPGLWPHVRAAAEPLGFVPSSGGGVPGDRSPVGVLRVDRELGAEAFRIAVHSASVTVTGGDPAGVFRALTVLRQLLPPAFGFVRGKRPAELPCVEVEDAPGNGWRGFMLDVARWYVEVDEILRLIDLMALLRLNVLHLHLTDDQGWRLHVDAWPRLTEVGAWRVGTTRRPPPRVDNADAADSRVDDDWGHGHIHDGSPHGGFYTRTEVRRIVAYAAERHITVVPEIELPGHAQAAIAAYPWLGAGRPDLPVATRWGISPHLLAPSEGVLAFLDDVFDEVADQFPAPYVHVGGDECPPDAWALHSRARMRVLGASKPDDLRGWFIDQVAERLDGLGRTALYWYDGAPRSRDAIAVAWQGGDGGLSAARAEATVIRAPHTQTYLDYRPSADSRRGSGLVLDLDTAHRFQVVPPGADATVADRFLGGQAQLWTEYAADREARDALLLPRLPAIADALWRGRDPVRADAFAMALAPLTVALTAAGFGSHEGPDPDEGGADAHPGPVR